MIAAGFPILSHPCRAVLRDYPRNLLSTGRGIAGERVPSPDSRVPYVWPPKKILCTADARCPPPLGTWDGERVFQLSGPEVEEAEIVNSLAGRLTLSKTVAGVVDI
jgi:hypothetical protein